MRLSGKRSPGPRDDRYVRKFWLETYPRYPKGADLPMQNRQFLRPPPVRRTLGHGESSFSVRGQVLLSKFQLEFMRRELAGSALADPFHFYCDEFQSIAGVAEGVWRELLSRGRKYGLSLAGC